MARTYKTNITIWLFGKLQFVLPRSIKYNSFVGTHLDYDDIIYDQAYNTPFIKNGSRAGLEGSSKEKLYQESVLKTFQQRRWYGKLCCFYKILKLK